MDTKRLVAWALLMAVSGLAYGLAYNVPFLTVLEYYLPVALVSVGVMMLALHSVENDDAYGNHWLIWAVLMFGGLALLGYLKPLPDGYMTLPYMASAFLSAVMYYYVAPYVRNALPA